VFHFFPPSKLEVYIFFKICLLKNKTLKKISIHWWLYVSLFARLFVVFTCNSSCVFHSCSTFISISHQICFFWVQWKSILRTFPDTFPLNIVMVLGCICLSTLGKVVSDIQCVLLQSCLACFLICVSQGHLSCFCVFVCLQVRVDVTAVDVSDESTDKKFLLPQCGCPLRPFQQQEFLSIYLLYSIFYVVWLIISFITLIKSTFWLI